MSAPIVIVSYDPQWPRLYQEEKARVLAAIGPLVVDIQHIGSTSVPGLAAKPIIDIMVAIERLADYQACMQPLQALGYEYVPAFETVIPERRFFRKGPPDARTHHLHMVERDSSFWESHLLFRDFLRETPDAARQYEQLKRELAGQYGANREAYSEAKTPFIREMEARAKMEKADSEEERVYLPGSCPSNDPGQLVETGND